MPWLLHWQGDGLVMRPIGTSDAEAPTITYTSPLHLPRQPEQAPLVNTLAGLGTVARVATLDLWDAITAAIFRHFGRAKQGAALYRSWCATYGQQHETPAGPRALPPTADEVLALSYEEFAAIRARVYRPVLRSAARAYLVHHEEWAALGPDELFKALCDVPRLGEWNAAAATADHTGDHSLYPHGDRALRTRARRAQPGIHLPRDDAEFVAMWRSWAPDRTQLHALTLFALTLGSHA
ncbi:hypothetical protein ACIGQE_14355 [Streptomyces sp. NPDC053429]|uniref:hypothetical protein n=1 Tax=Streptomyces sp. NPDC053429 TaxID=3365702 RepID=UPI0037D43403